MGLTKTEINLRRLLAAMPQQSNQAKLAQYVVTLKEQLALLTGETGQGNLPCISAEKAKEYAEQIEAAALRVDTSELNMWDMLSLKEGVLDGSKGDFSENLVASFQEDRETTSSGLRKRPLATSYTSRNKSANLMPDTSRSELMQKIKDGNDQGSALKVDSATLELIEKHRHLQDDLTDEMVDLARQIKEASLSMNQAVHDSEKVLDSTERAVEQSLASTNQANKRAQHIYSRSFATGCLSWLVMFVMICIFMVIVFLIRIT